MTPTSSLRQRVAQATGEYERLQLVRPLINAFTKVAGDAPSITVLVSDALGFKCSGAGPVEVGAALALVEKLLPEANAYGVEREPSCWTAYISSNFVEAEAPTAPLAILSALLAALEAQNATT